MIVLFRHGKTSWNEQGRLQGGGPKEGELTEEAYEVLERMASWAKSLTFDTFYLSPLKRAVDSFRQLHLQISGPTIKEDLLKEIDFGKYNGCVLKDIDPEVLREREKDKFHFRWEGGESYSDVDFRIRSFLKKYSIQPEEKGMIGILAHQTVNKFFLYHLTKDPKWMTYAQQNNEVVFIDGKEISMEFF